LLVFSQVVLSMQLPFAVIPLVRFVSDKRKMGKFAIAMPVAAMAWIVAGVIVVLNVKLLFDAAFG
jgi:manganese transport protein